jgi:ABC-type polysaccharide/polyol phosphate export permease
MSTEMLDSDRPRFAQALDDLGGGVRRWPLWGRLGWTDILQRYRRSVLGPVWITLSMAVMVSSLGLLYAVLFEIDLATYLPYLTIGFVLWGLISAVVIEGCTVFIGAEGVIKQISMPISVHVYRLVWKNILIFLHNIVVFFVVAVIFSTPLNWSAFLALAGMLLVVVNGVWISLLLGLLCARYRDASPIVASLIQLSFFVTPIIWKPDMVPDRAIFLIANPFFHIIEIVRAPLLGGTVAPVSWAVAVGLAVIGWAITIPIVGRYRAKMVYWL